MKKILPQIIFLFLSIHNIRAQSPFYGALGACERDFGQDLAFFPDGSKYILTNSESYSINNDEDIVITKLDSSNNHVWSKVFDGGLLDEGYTIKKYKQNILVSGTTRRNIGNTLYYWTLVMQIDTSGQLIWSYRYVDGLVYDMVILNNDDIVMTGKTLVTDRLFALSIDSTGSVKWLKEFYLMTYPEGAGQNIIQTSDGNIVISGYIGSISWTLGCRPVIIKLDTNGNPIWTIYYLINNNDYFYDEIYHKCTVLELPSDSSLIINGTFFNIGNPDLSYLLKVNSSDGMVTWNKTFDNNYFKRTEGVVDFNNNLYMYGYNLDSLYRVNISIMCMDLSGNVKWNKFYGSIREDKITKLVANNNKLQAIGYTVIYIPGFVTIEDSYFFEIDTAGSSLNLLDSLTNFPAGPLISFDPYDNLTAIDDTISNIYVSFTDSSINSLLDTTGCLTIGIDNHHTNNSITVFPNPFTSFVDISIPERDLENVSLRISDVLGKTMVANLQIQNSKIHCDLSFLPNGVYFLEISVGEERSVKMVVKE